jgi:hypothetical protein
VLSALRVTTTRETLIAFRVDKIFGIPCQALAMIEMATLLPPKCLQLA